MTKEFFIETVARLPLDDKGCKGWPFGQTGNGYGTVNINSKNDSTHRAIFKLLKNPELTDEVYILHSCDNKLCVNIEHLREGTAYNNIEDRVSRNRGISFKGELSPNSVLSDLDVEKIKSMYATGNYYQWEIAKKFRVSQSHIGNICRGTKRADGSGISTKKQKMR